MTTLPPIPTDDIQRPFLSVCVAFIHIVILSPAFTPKYTCGSTLHSASTSVVVIIIFSIRIFRVIHSSDCYKPSMVDRPKARSTVHPPKNSGGGWWRRRKERNMVIVNNSALKREARIRCTSLAPLHLLLLGLRHVPRQNQNLLIRILVGPTQSSVAQWRSACVL